MSKKLYLIDGYGFVFRAYHVLPPLTNPMGTPVGAVYGFTNMLLKVLREHHPDYIAVVFDSGKETFRNAIYDQYKANRPEAPEDLKPQFPLVRDAALALNLCVLEQQGFEADDIIATYVRRAKEQDIEVTIISSDKDLMQLIEDGRVQMYDPVKAKFIREAEVFEKFGVSPDKVLDVLSLMGDSSDNVPGVPGIGPKTAAELILQYDNLDELLLRAGEIKQNKRRETIIENKDKALLSKQLITLDCNVPLEHPIEDLKYVEKENGKVADFCRLHNFKALLAKITGEGGAVKTVKSLAQHSADVNSGQVVEESTQEVFKQTNLTSSAELKGWLANVREKLAVYFLDDAGVALAKKGESAFVKFQGKDPSLGFDFGDEVSFGKTEVLGILKSILNEPSILKITYNIKDVTDEAIVPFDDVAVMQYVTQTGLGSGEIWETAEGIKSLETLQGTGKSKRLLKDISASELTEFTAPRAEYIYNLHDRLKAKLFEDKLLTIYEKVDKPLVGILDRMERYGTKVDRSVLAGLSAEFQQKSLSLEQEIYQIAGTQFNIGSPAQIGEVLFDRMSISGGKKSKKTGHYSTGADILEELALQGHVIAGKILEWRQLNKLMSTYTESLPKQISPKDGRVHTVFNMTVTATGRLSSTEPNLQNIPIRSEEGKRIRTAFVAEPGNKVISADYSQIELRLLAHVANIPSLKTAFQNGQDVHAITAHQMFGMPLEEVNADYRRMAKTINFGIIYGLSAHGLAERLRIPRSDAAKFIEKYFEQYPGIMEYMDKTVEECRSNGYVETIFGRKLYIRGINDKNHAIRSFSERAAINAPLQGSAADIIKKAMIALDRIAAPMTLQVHDELLFEVKEAEAAEWAIKIKKAMETATLISVPLTVDANIGNNWGEVH